MKKEIILVGGGGHCRSCIDVIEDDGTFAIAGIIDGKECLGDRICGYEVIGTDQDIPGLLAKCRNFLVTVGQIKSPAARIRLFQSLVSMGADLPSIISPRARVARMARIGKGAIVMHHALVNSMAAVGDNCIINTRAVLEHDVQVGDHCHVSVGAILNGECRMGGGSFLGSGAIVVNGLEIPAHSVIGAGSLVRKSPADPGTYSGNPLRRIP